MKQLLEIQKRFYTCIVQRYKQPTLVKKGMDVRKQRIKSDHFHMKLVECEHNKKAGECDVILTDFVEGIGRKGEMVKVHRKVANTELIPAGLAVFPTDEYLELFKNDRVEALSKPKVSPFSAKTKAELMKITLDVPMNMSLDWTLKEDFIRVALRYQGINATNESIILPKNHEQIRNTSGNYYAKPFTIELKINDYTSVQMKCRIIRMDTDKYWQTFNMYNKYL